MLALPTLLLLLPSFVSVASAHKKRLNCNRPSHPRPSIFSSVGEFATQTISAAPVQTTVASTPPPQTTGASTGPGTWGLKETIIGHDFLDAFTADTFDDPTHGQVDYVDFATAASMNLTYATESSFVMRADSFNVVQPHERGRKSVRIASKNTYTSGVIIVDVKHMPSACGGWPAFWTVGPNWPSGGEIDIIEGVNLDEDNNSVLHTSENCQMPSSNRGQMKANPTGLMCTSSNGDNSGCGATYGPQPNSFGAPFNNAGGGTYAMRRSTESIQVWFWPVGSVPNDVASGASVVDEATWGLPSAVFPSTQCNIDEKFLEHQIVINLTFCGDWAGAAYGSSGCPSSCSDNVRNNPGAFTEAYWDINSLRTYA